ncbi:hypothetical protein GCM10022252_58460 [Streptosporangium oxazolinicum]|uniref:Uncharacterized protein n=1 Tax=Streptosporangium oxazolinicum TaxID=909287 RepID=A0ABP8BBJ4_9ACTN
MGLSGAVLLALAPLTGPSVAGAAIRTVAVEPSQIEGCDVDPAGPCEEEPTPIVTVTVTEDPQGGGSEESPVPQKTVTTTITVPASPKPKPTKTTAPPPPPQETAVAPPPPVQQTNPVVPPAETGTPENSDPQFPPTNPDPNQLPTVTPTPTPSDTAALDESAAGTSVYEIRNAGSEFDGATLSRQLGIPALILVLLVLFAVLIFEGRLRRLAHAAAIRRAGPRAMGRDPMDPMAYPGGPGYGAGPGYGPGPYQGGTAYAPIISFVPMQMYAPVYPEGYTPEQHPHGYDQTTAYMPAPGYEQQQPVAGHGDPYDPRAGQSPYAPTLQDGPAATFQGPSQHGPDSREGRLPQGAPEFPGAPFPQEPARGNTGFDGPRDDFRTFGSGTAAGDIPGQGPSQDPALQESRGDGGPEREVMTFGPEPKNGPGDRPDGGEGPPAEPTPTAVYPLPGQPSGKDGDQSSGKDGGKDTAKDGGKKKRGLFRRST